MDITKNMGRQIDQRHKQRLCFVPLPDAGQQTVLQLCIRHPSSYTTLSVPMDGSRKPANTAITSTASARQR